MGGPSQDSEKSHMTTEADNKKPADLQENEQRETIDSCPFCGFESVLFHIPAYDSKSCAECASFEIKLALGVAHEPLQFRYDGYPITQVLELLNRYHKGALEDVCTMLDELRKEWD